MPFPWDPVPGNERKRKKRGRGGKRKGKKKKYLSRFDPPPLSHG
jgi:hypothetical protein